MIDRRKRSNAVLVSLTTLGSAMCWWPALIESGIELPFWLPFACVALCTVLSITLGARNWPWLLLASGLGTFGGLSSGIMIWPPSDPIAAARTPRVVEVFAPATALAVMFVALCAGLIMRRRSLSNEIARRAIWALTIACVAFGPVAVAVTPAVVRHRLARNERLAAERLQALKKAVGSSETSRICDGPSLRNRYAGPSFSDTDWRRIAGNAVKQDGYTFILYCHEKGGYTISAAPAREGTDGTRRFCTDESDRVGCGLEFDGSRYKCQPCRK